MLTPFTFNADGVTFDTDARRHCPSTPRLPSSSDSISRVTSRLLCRIPTDIKPSYKLPALPTQSQRAPRCSSTSTDSIVLFLPSTTSPIAGQSSARPTSPNHPEAFFSPSRRHRQAEPLPHVLEYPGLPVRGRRVLQAHPRSHLEGTQVFRYHSSPRSHFQGPTISPRRSQSTLWLPDNRR